MELETTPKSSRPGYSRPTKYPDRIASMISTEQRAAIDDLVETSGESLGFIVRALLSEGLMRIGYKAKDVDAER